jgi:glycosyltransferase involved in cell wall biosynthesis
MMKKDSGVTLVAWSFDDQAGFGAARYAGGLLKAMKASGAAPATIDCGGYPQVPWDPSWRFTWYFNLRVLSCIPKTGIYHFTMDRPAYSIPFLRKAYGVRSVVSILDTRVSNPGESDSHLLRSGCLRKAVAEADLLIATSSSIREDLVRHFGADASAIREIPLPTTALLRPEKSRTGRPFTVGYLGRFEHHNNVEFAIRAFAAFKSMAGADARAKLVLYGTGPDLDRCRKLAAELGIAEVEFRGFIPGGRVSEAYGAFDAFIFPSRVEGFGLPVVEAQASGLPVIVLADSHIPEEVARFCMKARDEGHAAKHMLGIMENGYRPPAGQEKHLESFSIRNVTERTLRVYDELR